MCVRERISRGAGHGAEIEATEEGGGGLSVSIIHQEEETMRATGVRSGAPAAVYTSTDTGRSAENPRIMADPSNWPD